MTVGFFRREIMCFLGMVCLSVCLSVMDKINILMTRQNRGFSLFRSIYSSSLISPPTFISGLSSSLAKSTPCFLRYFSKTPQNSFSAARSS